MSIYVLGATEHGNKIWLENPKPWFNGKLLLLFDKHCAEAGVPVKRSHAEKSLMKRLSDELDQVQVPWVSLRMPRLGVLTVNKEDHEFFLMRIDLLGPLPSEIVKSIECEHRRKSLGLRQSIRYGG